METSWRSRPLRSKRSNSNVQNVIKQAHGRYLRIKYNVKRFNTKYVTKAYHARTHAVMTKQLKYIRDTKYHTKCHTHQKRADRIDGHQFLYERQQHNEQQNTAQQLVQDITQQRVQLEQQKKQIEIHFEQQKQT